MFITREQYEKALRRAEKKGYDKASKEFCQTDRTERFERGVGEALDRMRDRIDRLESILRYAITEQGVCELKECSCPKEPK